MLQATCCIHHYRCTINIDSPDRARYWWQIKCADILQLRILWMSKHVPFLIFKAFSTGNTYFLVRSSSLFFWESIEGRRVRGKSHVGKSFVGTASPNIDVRMNRMIFVYVIKTSHQFIIDCLVSCMSDFWFAYYDSAYMLSLASASQNAALMQREMTGANAILTECSRKAI